MKKIDIGVIVGRFQVPELHKAHKEIIQKVIDETRIQLIFIGVAPALGTREDPLDYTSREKMIRHKYPKAVVFPLVDRPSDEEWSKNLDSMIRAIYPIGSVCLYGGRDSFKKHYSGSLKIQTFDLDNELSGTGLREETGKDVRESSDFRAGIIYGSQNQYPRLHMTVDIALVKKNSILLGIKPSISGLIFPGGFVDPTDLSLEAAAARELSEETGFCPGVDDFKYVGSFPINDWRYQRDERIMTALFTCHYNSGNPVPAEEFENLDFHELNKKTLTRVAPNHKVLFEATMKDKKGDII